MFSSIEPGNSSQRDKVSKSHQDRPWTRPKVNTTKATSDPILIEDKEPLSPYKRMIEKNPKFALLLQNHGCEKTEETPKEEKRKDNSNNVPDLTKRVLKVCNVIRDKNFGSKVLYKQSGVICGAKSGTKLVNQPFLRSQCQSARRPRTSVGTAGGSRNFKSSSVRQSPVSSREFSNEND